MDDDEGTVIVNWQAPAARPFYTATPFEPHGVTLRRRFRTQGRKDGFLNRFLDTVWPAPRPEQVVRQLLSSRKRLAAASEGILDAGELTLLRRTRSGWSSADLPLLDEARAVLHGAPILYGHVIVDEGQDLTPMQLRMIARRTAGSFTILGDVAQATGPISYGRWEELLAFLPGGDRAEIEELRHAYRVPREIMSLALPLLEHIAPDVEPPVAYRAGAEPPRIVHGDPPMTVAYEEAARLGGEEGLLAVIAPASLRGDTDEAPGLFDDTRISVLTRREAKGMEFDHVIVVEPALVVEEARGGQGVRELYVALTADDHARRRTRTPIPSRATRLLTTGHGRFCHLALRPRDRHHRVMDAAFDERDVTSILSGVFDMRTSLAEIANDIRAIRLLLEDDDEEEEEEAAGEGPPA